MEDMAIRQPVADMFKRLATDFGIACSLLFECGQGKFTLASAYMWIMPAIRHRQIEFLFAADGRPMGYVTWAFVSDEALARLQADTVHILEASEWNEGLNLWIIDVVCRKGKAQGLIGTLRKRLGTDFTLAHGLKRRPDGSMRRLVSVPVRAGEVHNGG